jgi:hypothetical protein
MSAQLFNRETCSGSDLPFQDLIIGANVCLCGERESLHVLQIRELIVGLERQGRLELIGSTNLVLAVATF